MKTRAAIAWEAGVIPKEERSAFLRNCLRLAPAAAQWDTSVSSLSQESGQSRAEYSQRRDPW